MFIEPFLDYVALEQRRAPTTVRTYRESLCRVERRCGVPIHKVGVLEMRSFLRSGDYATGTIALTLTAVKRFHAWGALIHQPSLWPLNGIMELRPPRVRHDTPEPLLVDEARALLEACQLPHEYRLVYLTLLAGCRIDEALRMVGDTWLPDRLTFVGKGSRKRSIPLHRDLREAKHIIDRSRLEGPRCLYDARDDLAVRTGIYFTPHQLRHTFGTHLYENCGVQWEVARALLGHSLGTTGLYVRIPWAKKVEAIGKLAY